MTKKTILSDPYLVLTGLVISVLVVSLCVLMVGAIHTDYVTFTTENGKILVESVFSFFAVAWIVTMILSSRAWLLIITFSEQSVSFWRPFSNGKQMKMYKDFPYVYRCFFQNGCRYYYIVLTNRKLTEHQMSHINQASNSNNLIKLRYTKKNHKILLEILPRKQRDAMIRCFGMLDECKR